ncbi:aminotransferase [Roseitranquillus sediminis]|uniref:aminotransferase n=1 Tax=Roseitranquillus sediminis TaxID=2809051 RepID=UPI001D0CDB04|nr:aminotransferase [Roseitranquillus sediminis]MBM9594433.1 aminotransferase [Roseitranquillus sediminis]
MHMPPTASTFAPPVMEARRWLEGVAFPRDQPLINVSQAAPVDPPPEPLLRAMADTVLHDPTAHLYGPVLGLPALREELAAQWTRAYGGTIMPEHVAITQGCNQAFCAAISATAGPGDEVILPTPWYFNHKMWLDMAGVRAVPLATADDLLPNPDRTADLVTGRTRAIVLVTPNNPGGVEYPAETLAAFRDLARSRGLKLILDETYRDFHGGGGAPHALFQDAGWQEVLIHLYSFSKSYRLTGHRVGALVAGRSMLAEVEKFLDTVGICAPQVGQRAALWGMRHLGDWLSEQRREILERRAAVAEGIARLPGWRLLGCGAYFAYVEHPSGLPSDQLAPDLVRRAGVLLLPGTMFMPSGDERARRQLRIAFANIDADGIDALIRRLAALDLTRALT